MGIKISYLVSTYNGANYLDSHLQDLLENQIDPNFEIIVVNPNSPDKDDEIAKKWALKDNRVQYCFWPMRENYGESWIRAWEMAKAPYLVNSNIDDAHHSRFTSVFYNTMQSMLKNIAFSYAGLRVIDEQKNLIGGGYKPKFDFYEYSHTCWGGPQLCWRNDEEFKSKLNFDFMKRRAKEYTSAYDFWQILYFMSLGYHGYVIPEILTIYMQRKSSIENSSPALNNYESLSSISEFFNYHFHPGGKLYKDFPEFADFSNLPPRDEWIENRRRGKKWKYAK